MSCLTYHLLTCKSKGLYYQKENKSTHNMRNYNLTNTYYWLEEIILYNNHINNEYLSNTFSKYLICVTSMNLKRIFENIIFLEVRTQTCEGLN